MNNIIDFINLNKDLNIKNIMVDSRKKLDNSIFFCIVGLTVDGHDFINNAIDNGAICIVHSKEISNKLDNIVYIKVANTTDALNEFANYFYGKPSEKMKIYGFTGTNGKTTSAYIIYDLLNKLNTKAAYIGTLGYKYNNQMHEQYFTTPNINDLHMMLKEIYDADCKACAIEVSSQGLDLHRTDSVDFDCVSFSNLTHEHLDYHKTFEDYFNAKARLFENMKSDGIACINIDDEYGVKMISRCKCKVVTYGVDNNADYKANDIKLFSDHCEFVLTTNNQSYNISTNLVAKFNIYNLLSVIASLIETGYDVNDIIPLLNNIESVPGRCMHINEGQDYNVIVDFAHTPDGFIKILEYAKAITSDENHVVVLFGMRGSGDIEKRAICGEIADKYCDDIYITSDDNHEEDPNQILDNIASGIKYHPVHRILSREEAIIVAIKSMRKGDTLCILGKGVDDFYKENHKIVPYEGDHILAARAIKEHNN